jgi:predicted 3-demethylubiquinone-9 3-methyltransferase (glyoxalase superfamily)
MQHTPSRKITPFLMIDDGKAEEAAQFYVSIFPKDTSRIIHVAKGSLSLSHLTLFSYHFLYICFSFIF